MAIVAEKPFIRTVSGEEGGTPVLERGYDVHGVASEEEAKDEVRNFLTTVEAPLLQRYRILEIVPTEIIPRPGVEKGDVYTATARLVLRSATPPTPKPVPEYAFDVSTVTFTLRQAYAQRQFNAEGAVTPPIHGTAINVEKRDGLFVTNGVGVMTPIGALRVSLRFPMEYMAELAAKSLHKVGMVNSEEFDAGEGFVFEAEEVLFGGANIVRASPDECQATYNFLVSPADPEPAPIDGIAYEGKKGWEYLWCEYETAEVTHGGLTYLSQQAINVFLARVYKRTSFASIMSVD